jgi:hypothetical protein
MELDFARPVLLWTKIMMKLELELARPAKLQEVSLL